MDATTIRYGVACVAVLAFTGWSRDVSKRAFAFACLLSATCLLTNLLNLNLYYPQALVPYPIIDMTAGAIVAMTIWGKPRLSEVLLSLTFLIQCAVHAIFWRGQAQGQGYEAVGPYMDNLGDVLKVQLALVCIPGGIHVGRQFYASGSRTLLRMFLRSRGGLGHHNQAPKS